MFVLEALVLTFMTTPLVTWLYPLHLRRRISAIGVFEHVADDEAAENRAEKDTEGEFKARFTVVLDKLEHVAGMMALTQLVQPYPAPLSGRKKTSSTDPSTSLNAAPAPPHVITMEALRLIELSDRVSAVMKSSISDYLLRTDAVLSIFSMFGQLNGIRVTPSISVVKFDDLAYSVAEHARNHGSDMIFLPWLPPTHDGQIGDGHQTPLSHSPIQQAIALPATATGPVSPPPMKSPVSHNPFEALFRSSNFKSAGGATGVHHGGADVSSSVAITHSQFVRGVFAQSTTDVALFVDQTTLDSIIGSGKGIEEGYEQYLFLPFFGGPDDRLALEFVVQICANPRVRGTVVRMTKTDASVAADVGAPSIPAPVHLHEDLSHPKTTEELNQKIAGFPDTVYGYQNTETRLQSETADNILWARYADGRGFNAERTSISSGASSSARPRIEFTTLSSPIPLQAAIQNATHITLPSTKVLIVTGRSRRLAPENHRQELQELMQEHGHVGTEVRKTVGDVATAFVVAGVGSGIVVLQAAGAGNID